MAIDDDDEPIEDSDPGSFEDPVAERARAFVFLAQCADNLKSDETRGLVHTMMRKVSASIRAPSTAEVVSIHGGKAS